MGILRYNDSSEYFLDFLDRVFLQLVYFLPLFLERGEGSEFQLFSLFKIVSILHRGSLFCFPHNFNHFLASKDPWKGKAECCSPSYLEVGLRPREL